MLQSGPVTRKKLGLRDVLGKLNHFSLSVRYDSLEGLKVPISFFITVSNVQPSFDLNFLTSWAPLFALLSFSADLLLCVNFTAPKLAVEYPRKAILGPV